MVISACIHPCGTNIFTHSVTRIHYCNWKSIISEWNQKFFHLGINEIPTLKLLYESFLIKLSADISHNSFVLGSLLKTNIFPKFLAGNSFLFFKRLWNIRLSDRCHFFVNFLAWKKPLQLFSIFLFYCIKMFFIKSYIYTYYMVI